MRGFTLLELLLVLFVLGVILGSSMVLAGRFDPGPVGLRASASAFFESSRDRARASGRPVVVEIEPEADGFGRLRRLVFRSAREATFEPGSEKAQGLEPTSSGVSIGEVSGRFGAALELTGGQVEVAGRGGQIQVGQGFGLELHLRARLDQACVLLEWKDLLKVQLGRDGGLRAELEMGEGAGLNLRAPAGSLRPERWHHLALEAADGGFQIRVDGRTVASDVYSTGLAQPLDGPLLGDPDGAYFGLIDEFSIWNRVVEYGPDLREQANLVLGAPRLIFGPDGLLDPSLGDGVQVDLVNIDQRVESFLVGRFSEQEVGG